MLLLPAAGGDLQFSPLSYGSVIFFPGKTVPQLNLCMFSFQKVSQIFSDTLYPTDALVE